MYVLHVTFFLSGQEEKQSTGRLNMGESFLFVYARVISDTKQ